MLRPATDFQASRHGHRRMQTWAVGGHCVPANPDLLKAKRLRAL